MVNFKKNKGLCIALTAFTGFIAFNGYARIWEYRQPTEEIKNTIVREIRPYYVRSEMGSFRGNKLYIEGEDRFIDFPSGKWDKTVKTGDSVDLVVRRSFPLFGDELDGIHIDDHK